MHGVRYGVEGADRSTHCLGQGVQAQRDFGEDAQRAFAAHQQAGQVIARRALFGAVAGADDLTAGRHHFQRQHVLAHGAVAHGVRAAGACGSHAAYGGISTGVNGEKQALILDGIVQGFAQNARLHRHGHVFGIHANDLVHARDIQAHTALHGQQMAFQRCARAIRDDWHLVLGGQLDAVRHILCAVRIHHGHRWWCLNRAFIAAMLLAHGLRGGALCAKARLQGIDKGWRNGTGQLRGVVQCVHLLALTRNVKD